MKYEDLSFEITNKKGLQVICDITAVIPDKESENPYVTFTDYTFDEEGNFTKMYGKVIGDELHVIEDVEEIAKIEELAKDEITEYVNTQINENKEV